MEEIKITINNRSYGDLNGTDIYLTEDLYNKLSSQKVEDGQTMLNLLEQGMALQGMKHLIASIKMKNKEAKIIFNLRSTKKENNSYFINFSEYKTKSKEIFFPLYKETGFKAANSYLNKNFPDEFEREEEEEIWQVELRRLDKDLPKVLNTITKKDKNKTIVIEETAKTVRNVNRKDKKQLNALLNLQKQ